MKTSDFYYDLPQELIAQDPLEDRSSSRLMHLDKVTGEVEHRHFREILEYLKPGDCLVINDTKVIPARLYGRKVGTDAAIEILLLKRKENDIWETLVKPGKKCKPGTVISFGDGILTGEVIDVVEEGNRLIQFHYEGIFEEILDRLGEMPLPPYITHKLKDKDRYQTVYAKHEGSAAAPTAGLHFTKELLEQVEQMGVKIAHVTLHVGLGTFRPVKVEDVTQHHMHSEFYVVEEDQAKLIQRHESLRPSGNFRWNNQLQDPGVSNRGRWNSQSGKRMDRDFHLSGLSVPDDRRIDHEFPSAGIHTADAGVGAGGKRAYHGGL